MTVARAPRFKSFEEYLEAEPGNLPEGRFEYCDGELIPLMAEGLGNGTIAIRLQLALIALGIPCQLIRPVCEVEVPGRPRTRIPDLVMIEMHHLALLRRRSTITRDMLPPRLIVEVVSPGNENSDNYQRDYEVKPVQYATIGVREYWMIDPERSVVRIGALINGQYQFQEFRGGDAVVSPTFTEFNRTAAEIIAWEN
jgi:Uma2 family endonuclease